VTRALGRDQLAAAALSGGPVRVVAGAGTGKTAVIAERFRRLVASGVDPESILVMTFTERAAGEMRQRIESSIDRAAPAVGTFHSVALGWLRAEGRAVGLPAGFRILAGADRWILARELMWSLGDAALTGEERPDDLVSPALQMLERMKQELVPIEKLAAWASATDEVERGALMRACVRLFRAYEKECRAKRLADFDDLLLMAVRLLERKPEVLRRFRARYPHVLVDEYQDLNLAQERLVELVAEASQPFVVGDDDQSIYRFRGASRASLERFLRSFPESRTITLGLNRRSSRRIVGAAATLIANNLERLPKKLQSDRSGPSVELWSCPDGISEAHAIASEAERLIKAGIPPSEVAVLCRTNAIARPLAAAMAARGLPHVLVGGHGFHDQPEVRDVIALLRVLRDPSDEVALARVMTRPPANLDAGSVLAVLRDRKGASPIEALKSRPPSAAFATLLDELAAAARQLDVRDLFFELMEGSRYLPVLTASLGSAEAARATGNISRFAEAISEFCEVSPDHSLANYMAHLDLVLLSGEDEEQAPQELDRDGIQVMTIHQAKGLEFDAVFVPALVEGRLPQSGRSPRFELPQPVLEPLVRGREDVIAEERRLLYVAMTRAKRRLYLTRASHYEGGRGWRESRFIEEVRVVGPRSVRAVEIASCPQPAPQSPSQPHHGEIHLSYSAISTYRECPMQYWYRHEQRLPAVQSAEAVHGVILHDVLRRCGELRRQGRRVTSEVVRSTHSEVWSATDFPDSRRAGTFKRNGLAQLEAYRKRGGLFATPAFLEQPFTLDMGGWSLRGVIDRIDPAEDGWRIIDYKSGRPTTRRKRDLQLALYTLGARAALSLDPIELEVVYLASGESVPVTKVDGLLDTARQEGTLVAEGIRSGRFEPTPERRRCRLCPYRLVCPVAL
jgi:DNA helicase II / ATP-dependent DNA helicase PcrA